MIDAAGAGSAAGHRLLQTPAALRIATVGLKMQGTGASFAQGGGQYAARRQQQRTVVASSRPWAITIVSV